MCCLHLGSFLFISLLGLSVLLLLMGGQRLEKYQLENEWYNKVVRYLSLLICFTGVLFVGITASYEITCCYICIIILW